MHSYLNQQFWTSMGWRPAFPGTVSMTLKHVCHMTSGLVRRQSKRRGRSWLVMNRLQKLEFYPASSSHWAQSTTVEWPSLVCELSLIFRIANHIFLSTHTTEGIWREQNQQPMHGNGGQRRLMSGWFHTFTSLSQLQAILSDSKQNEY